MFCFTLQFQVLHPMPKQRLPSKHQTNVAILHDSSPLALHKSDLQLDSCKNGLPNQNSHCQLTSQRGSCVKPFLSLSDSELIKGKGLINYKLEWTCLVSHQLPRMYCVWQWHMHDATCVKSSVHCHDSAHK